MGKDDEDVFNKIKDYVINTRFKSQIKSQISASIIEKVKYKLSTLDIPKDKIMDIQNTLNTAIDIVSINKCETEKYESALDILDYEKILELFNEKGLAKSVGHYFGIENDEYCNTVLRLLSTEMGPKIVSAVSLYLPPEIPKE